MGDVMIGDTMKQVRPREAGGGARDALVCYVGVGPDDGLPAASRPCSSPTLPYMSGHITSSAPSLIPSFYLSYCSIPSSQVQVHFSFIIFHFQPCLCVCTGCCYHSVSTHFLLFTLVFYSLSFLTPPFFFLTIFYFVLFFCFYFSHCSYLLFIFCFTSIFVSSPCLLIVYLIRFKKCFSSAIRCTTYS